MGAIVRCSNGRQYDTLASVLIGSMSSPNYSSAGCVPAAPASASFGVMTIELACSKLGLHQTQHFFYSHCSLDCISATEKSRTARSIALVQRRKAEMRARLH